MGDSLNGQIEYWRSEEYKQEKKKESCARRRENVEKSIKIVKEHGFFVKRISEHHYRVEGRFNFWPSTGTWNDMLDFSRGRGVFELIKKLKGK